GLPDHNQLGSAQVHGSERTPARLIAIRLEITSCEGETPSPTVGGDARRYACLLGTRLEMPQRISYTTVLARVACSCASTLRPSLAPSKMASSPTAMPGRPVTSTSVRSIEMRPTMGA